MRVSPSRASWNQCTRGGCTSSSDAALGQTAGGKERFSGQHLQRDAKAAARAQNAASSSSGDEERHATGFQTEVAREFQFLRTEKFLRHFAADGTYFTTCALQGVALPRVITLSEREKSVVGLFGVFSGPASSPGNGLPGKVEYESSTQDTFAS